MSIFTKNKDNFLYTITKVKSKSSKLFKKDIYEKLIHMSISEISNFLSDNGYYDHLIPFVNKFSGSKLIEYASYKNMYESFKSILNSSKGDLYSFIYLLLEKWDFWNLKLLIRGKLYNQKYEDISDNFIPLGKFSLSDLSKIYNLSSINNIISFFNKKERTSILKLKNLEKESNSENINLSDIDDSLDKFYYDQIIKNITSSSIPDKILLNYFHSEINITNFLTLIKFKKENYDFEKISSYLIKGGKKIKKNLLLNIQKSKNIREFIDCFCKFNFYPFLNSSLLLQEPNSFTELIPLSKKYLFNLLHNQSLTYPLSNLPILNYFIKKENEVLNIQIISRGIENNIDIQELKKMVIL